MDQALKNRTDKPRQMSQSQFFIKVAGVYFGNSVHDNWNWGTLYDRLTKKFIFGTKCGSL